jgi:hypothetical protein
VSDAHIATARSIGRALGWRRDTAEFAPIAIRKRLSRAFSARQSIPHELFFGLKQQF